MPARQKLEDTMTHSSPLAAISAYAFAGEADVLRAILKQAEPLAQLEKDIMARARQWAEAIRKEGTGHGMEAFLHTYGLDTREGVALMCLAEALLRIPDAGTADNLIKDTFEGKDWRKNAESSDSWLISASSWGLLLTGKVVDFGEDAAGGIAGTIKSLTAKIGEPVIRQALKQAMRVIGSQFVLGETIKEGLDNARSWEKQGFRFSYDILGEGARSEAQAQGYIKSYHEAIALVGKAAKDIALFAAPSISVKLSALHPRYSLSKRERVLSELAPRLIEILKLARQHNITVSIDAEEANRLDIELELFAHVLAHPALSGWNGTGFVVQAYQKRATLVIDYLADLARQHKKIIPLRLVKGAYWDSEIKHAQVMGLPGYPVFTRKEHTDVSYLAAASKMLQRTDCFYPQFATHNARTIASIEAMAKKYGVGKDGFEFQRLHGMGEKLHAMVVKEHPSRVYAPIGAHKDLLAYLIRRLLENGANTSFVNLLMDKETTLDELLADPVAKTKENLLTLEGRGMFKIPLPADIYHGARKNSQGMDPGYLAQREPIEAWLQSQKDAKVPAIAALSLEQLSKNIGAAAKIFPQWAKTPVEERARLLEKTADLLEEKQHEAIFLLVHEAGKTVPDAVAEVREAADFCRYYAAEARRIMPLETLAGPTGESNQIGLYPRGVFGCISPWNFPLAIFAGQVTAALATGNCVIAKPAKQTPAIADFAVKIMHEAGIPKDAVQLAPGGGGTVGNAIVEDERICGIVLTGSVEVAQHINRTLAARKGPIVPLIAETGGQNCMVVDSSALLEQAVDDIITSAFGSAGQRCSALRVLYVQDDIADDLITLLKGAMQEISLGFPGDFSTDVGPVIDKDAQKSLMAHIERMKKSAKLIAAAPFDEAAAGKGAFVPPHAFEIKSIGELEGEVFGPALHVVRFKSSEMQKVADAINSTGFGLTFGMHSRIQDHIDFFATRIHAGNLYINRNMIGAVVGVQPFGGEGLSGTGPKAGGPHYLLKFASERTLTVNTAAIGGNVALLSSES